MASSGTIAERAGPLAPRRAAWRLDRRWRPAAPALPRHWARTRLCRRAQQPGPDIQLRQGRRV